VAQGPICIITPSGMVCCSSKPMKQHFPKVGDEVPSADTDNVCHAVETALAPYAKLVAVDTILSVVQLMVHAKVTDKTPFTITATMEAAAKPVRSA
jgi:hypothetical protein